MKTAGCSSDALHGAIWQHIGHGGKWTEDCMTGIVPSGAARGELWQWNDTMLTIDWTSMFTSRNERCVLSLHTAYGCVYNVQAC